MFISVFFQWFLYTMNRHNSQSMLTFWWTNIDGETMMNVDHFSRNTQESHGFSTSFCLPPGYLPGEDARFFVWRPARWANWMFDVAKYDKERNNFTFGRGGNQGARGENKGKALGVGRFVCRFFVARLWPLGVSKNCIFRMIVFSNGRKVESLKGGLSRLLEKRVEVNLSPWIPLCGCWDGTWKYWEWEENKPRRWVVQETTMIKLVNWWASEIPGSSGNCPKDSPDFSRRGGDFFIENVMEELDYPGEFFFDKRTEKLYLFHNGLPF